jgi:COP9 signalosome complex subunit 1
MCLAVIKCAIELGNFVHVNSYVTKAEQSVEASKDPITASKLKCAGALAALESKKYRVAAKKFSEVGREVSTPLSRGANFYDNVIHLCKRCPSSNQSL